MVVGITFTLQARIHLIVRHSFLVLVIVIVTRQWGTWGFLIDILLPDELIEFTQIMPRKQCENWCLSTSNLLCQDSIRINLTNPKQLSLDPNDKLSYQKYTNQKSSKTLRLESVEFCVNQDFVMATVGQERFKLRPNNLNSIFIAA
eukprot:gene39273-51743_t